MPYKAKPITMPHAAKLRKINEQFVLALVSSDESAQEKVNEFMRQDRKTLTDEK